MFTFWKKTFDRSKFYNTVRANLGILKASQVKGFEAVLNATEGQPLAHRAYSLATAWHETNKTMLPVVEAYWLSEAWRKKNLRYYPWHGRGYVQLTWEANYKNADQKLGLRGALLANPDMALDANIAAKIMRIGMDEGWFTKYKLSDCLPLKGRATREQYMKARHIINGTDKADLIEDYAQAFEKALIDAGMS